RQDLGGDPRHDAALELGPVLAVVEEGTRLLDNVADMRLALEILGAELPDLAIGRVRQLEAAVAAIDGDRLVEIVERLALDLDQGIVQALEGKLVGDVLVDEGEAAERVGRNEVAQGSLVGQMKQPLIRLDERIEHGELLLLEGAEVGVFRNAPALAQALENLAEARLGGKPFLLEPP